MRLEMSINRVGKALEHTDLLFKAVVGIVFVGSLGLANYLANSLTREQIFFSFFYLIPIVLVTWSVNESLGLIVSGLSALAWLIAESALDESYRLPVIYF